MTATVTDSTDEQEPPAFIFPNGSIHYADVEPDLMLEHMIATQVCAPMRSFDLHHVVPLFGPRVKCRGCRTWWRDERMRRRQLALPMVTP